MFDGYCEGTLTFKPTYKYDVGSSNYDTSYKVVTECSLLISCFFDSMVGDRSSHKFGSLVLTSQVRVPSWTDRILFKIRDTEEIRASLHSYESVDDIHSSDHKPVKAHLCLKVNEQP